MKPASAVGTPKLQGTEATALFVPGDRPDRFPKAQRSGADCVIIDLEDAVAEAHKGPARVALLEFLTAPICDLQVPTIVRVNPADSSHFAADADVLASISTEFPDRVAGIMLAKAESAEHLFAVRSAIPAALPVIPLIETARGLLAAREIARLDGVARLAFGAIDFALDVGCSMQQEALLHARSELVIVSRAGGIVAPWDSPTAEITDHSAVRDSAVHARMLGFGGKLCIHPSQIEVVAAAFLPSDAEYEWALRVIGAVDGASAVDGAMVDRPVIARAAVIVSKRIYARTGGQD